MYPKKNRKAKDKLYTLEDAKKELMRREEAHLYFVDFMSDVSQIIDSCYSDSSFMAKYGSFMPRQ